VLRFDWHQIIIVSKECHFLVHPLACSQ